MTELLQSHSCPLVVVPDTAHTHTAEVSAVVCACSSATRGPSKGPDERSMAQLQLQCQQH